jgi:asparagine synthase (glutamine-hydrolysing)
MCGICGILNYDIEQPVEPSIMKAMNDVMLHRGPDDEGFYVKGNIGLGHRRLSIIDLATGQQPMSNEDKTVWIVYNGEIYNYLNLRKDLQNRGHLFSTHSDTETIVHAYEEYGAACTELIRGMFAFAIWDAPRQRLFLARDRLGIKPVYYSLEQNRILFASEIKALLAGGVRAEVNQQALDSYLTLGYVPAPNTMFKGIYKLLPGYNLTVSKGDVRLNKYWDFDHIQPQERPESYYSEKLLELLTDCVDMRLMSEVPLGVFLSGGLDSSTVVSILGKKDYKPLRTFSVGYNRRYEDCELEYADIVAKHFQTEHHELNLESLDFFELITKIIWHMDEPVLEAAAIPLYLLSQFSRRYVTVMLSGEGSDELFGGYLIYKHMCAMEYFDLMPDWLRSNALGPLMRRLANSRRAVKYSDWFSLPLEKRYLGVKAEVTDTMRNWLYSPGLRELAARHSVLQDILPYYERVREKDALSQMLYVDTKVWLPDDLLTKADKMTMANSIELRVPFLDHKMVEFAAAIPSRYKLKRWNEKYILKQAVAGIVPQAIINRPKRGFPVPISTWFANELNQKAKEVLLEEKTQQRGYFNRQSLEAMLDKQSKGKEDWSAQIFSLLTLELWNRKFIDK